MKQIETGCLAVVIGARIHVNNGKVVTVGRYIGSVPGCLLQNRWEVSEYILNNYGELSKHISQELLLRIDGEPELDEELAELELSK
jgi:hypothetical protein